MPPRVTDALPGATLLAPVPAGNQQIAGAHSAYHRLIANNRCHTLLRIMIHGIGGPHRDNSISRGQSEQAQLLRRYRRQHCLAQQLAHIVRLRVKALGAAMHPYGARVLGFKRVQDNGIGYGVAVAGEDDEHRLLAFNRQFSHGATAGDHRHQLFDHVTRLVQRNVGRNGNGAVGKGD